MITPNDLLPKIKSFQELDDSNYYDAQLLLYISSGMSELKNSGIPIPNSLAEDYIDQYINIINIEIILLFDNDVNINQYKLIRENQIENLRTALLGD